MAKILVCIFGFFITLPVWAADYNFDELSKRCVDKKGVEGLNQLSEDLDLSMKNCGRLGRPKCVPLRCFNLPTFLRAYMFFIGGDLRGSQIGGGIYGTWLGGSNLQGAVFLPMRGDILDLSRADLRSANLLGLVNVTQVWLQGALFNSKTLLPFSREDAVRLHGMVYAE